MPEMKRCPVCSTPIVSGVCCDPFCPRHLYAMPRLHTELEDIEAWNKLNRKTEKSDATDTPTSPDHYARWKIQPLDFIQANNLDFMRGNIIKYIMRYDAKDGLEDLEKARVYLDRLIEKAEWENDNP